MAAILKLIKTKTTYVREFITPYVKLSSMPTIIALAYLCRQKIVCIKKINGHSPFNSAP